VPSQAQRRSFDHPAPGLIAALISFTALPSAGLFCGSYKQHFLFCDLPSEFGHAGQPRTPLRLLPELLRNALASLAPHATAEGVFAKVAPRWAPIP
jgi:hypothetical protein